VRLNNEQQDSSPIQIADLPVVDGEADEVRCGTAVTPVVNYDTGFKWNHNETIVSDQEYEVGVTDLSITDEQADGVSGGPITFPSKGGGMWIGN